MGEMTQSEVVALCRESNEHNSDSKMILSRRPKHSGDGEKDIVRVSTKTGCPPVAVDSLISSGFTLVKVADNFLKLSRFCD